MSVLHDNRLPVILHFDFDCFYCSVHERQNPALKGLPFAVQQKQIIVTCNYEARRRGLSKLQLVAEAKKIVPDLVIVLGEDLTLFRDASKELYKFLETFSWNGKIDKLGFDEIFMDVTDIIDFNQGLLNPHDLAHSFFQLKRDDPTTGFPFDATIIAGHGYPNTPITSSVSPDQDDENSLMTRLILGSHLAQHLRWALEEEKGFTSSVGISSSKVLSKLIGNLNKPKGQTTLLPPYTISEKDRGVGAESNVRKFLDGYDIGKIPGIGFKISQRIRSHVLSRPADFDTGLIYGGTKESVTVQDVRLFPGMGPETLEKILGGPGAERGIGGKIWNLINGIDNSEVQQAKKVPSQISIEDSYVRLDNTSQALKELRVLSASLLKRMHIDLLEDDDDPDSAIGKRWIAHPKTIRLSTRPRPPLNPDGTRSRSFNRISKSGPLLTFVFSLKEEPDSVVEKLVQETLVPMFRKLHPSPRGWNLSLVNIGVTNMVEAASEDSKSGGRDIGRMFKRQEQILKEWNVEDRDIPPDPPPPTENSESHNAGQIDPSAGNEVSDSVMAGSEDSIQPTQTTINEEQQGIWEDDEDEDEGYEKCSECGAIMPAFALAAHERFHSLEE